MSFRLQPAVLNLRFLLPLLLILATGLLMLYSVTSPAGPYGLDETRDSYTISRAFFNRQLLWVFLGLLATLTGSMIPFWIFKDSLSKILYAAGLIVLILILVLPPMRGDTHRWLMIGPFGIQPSEFFKILMIFMLASYLAGRKGDPNRLRVVAGALALVLPPAFLVLRQPDLGTAMTFLWLVIPMLVWKGFDLRRLLIMSAPALSAFIVLYGQTVGSEGFGLPHWAWGIFIVALMAVAIFYPAMRRIERILWLVASVATGLMVPLFWGALRSYQQKRILVFFDPDLDRLGAGYQIFQSKVAIGSGGLLGRGFLEGTQKGLAFLPARHTDFIFSVLGEEFGFIGTVVILGIFAYLIMEGVRLAARVRQPFAALLSVGVSAYLLFHVFVNVAMTIGLAPVTGLPLPGLSFGGSVLMSTCFLVGVQMNISRNWARY
jgi:rod shape determining protein RodA